MLGTIEQFLKELCSLDVKKNQIFAVSIHFLRRGCNIVIKFGIKVYNDYIELKFDFGCDRVIFGRIIYLRIEKFQLIQFLFVFFSEDANIETKFGIEVYHVINQVKFNFGCDRAIFDGIMPHGL